MIPRIQRLAFLVLVAALSVAGLASAQSEDDPRAQLPRLLRDSYFSIGIGALDTPLSDRQLEPGFTGATVTVPKVAVRALLFGHEFNRYVGFQAGYLRPVSYIRFKGINGRPETDAHTVRTTFGTLTLKVRAPIGPRMFVYGETGYGLGSRTGFQIDGRQAVADAHYASLLMGGGVDAELTPNWALTAGFTVIPGRDSIDQPRTTFISGGFRYTLRALPQERVGEVQRAAAVFPRQMVYVEISTGVGYGVNNFVSKTVPVFWGGDARVDRGVAVHYEKNVFHAKRLFSFDIGASAGTYRTQNLRERFGTVSFYPLLRLTFIRTAAADMYFAYSLAGPTFISKTILDGHDTGRRFTFQDFMGVGFFLGKARHLNAGVKINHYSNGNIFTQNAGVKIPLTFSVGYTF
jgi:opacity protein-like surface antigen